MQTERPRMFDILKTGLAEAIAQERGEVILRRTEIVIPEPPEAYSPEDIRRIRTRLHMSQPGFARLLQVSSKTVQGWEQGTKQPRQSAARLLQFIEHPDMLTEIARIK